MRSRHALSRFVGYINRRWQIYKRRAAGAPPPWTSDPILRTWKFTNVCRNLDRTTRWIHQTYRVAEQHRLLPLNLALARFLNRVATLQELRFQYTWDPHQIRRVLEARQQRGEPVWGAAYIIACASGRPKITHVVHDVLDPATHLLGPALAGYSTIESAHRALRTCYGFGDFLSQEVLLDVAELWAPVHGRWVDRDDWAVAGPGALRGLNRLYGRAVRAVVSQTQRQDEMHEIRELVLDRLVADCPVRTLHDIEFNLCEFDKYERVRLGEGTPRSRYRYPPIAPTATA